jgi:hypothetical protein
MAAGSNKRVTIWTYAAACRTLPYVRLLLRDLRGGFIAIWHLYRLAGGDVNHSEYQDRIRRLGDEARTIFKELDRLGVIAYQSPLRGIALFPFIVRVGEGSSREAYFVFKDTRDEIDSYIYADDLCERNDLNADEKPVPEEWKKPGVIPMLEREARP